jgi:hypothetical protein
MKNMAVLALVFLPGSCGGGHHSVASMPQRKNAATLSSAELAEFVTTQLRRKTLPSQFALALSAYDYFVDLHVRAFAGHSGAHMAPGFLPWHREFLRRFNQHYNVPLPNALQVASLLDVPRRYDAAPCDMFADRRQSMRNHLDGSWPSGSARHNAVHVWVGAQMRTASLPNDPVFFLHHANIDRPWSLWQARYGNDSYPADGMHRELEPLFQFGEVTPRQTFDLQQHSGVRYQ